MLVLPEIEFGGQ